MNYEDDIHQIGGLHKTEIEALTEGLRARITALEKVVCPNGREGLEDRMVTRIMAEIASLRKYVDERDDHKQNSVMQAIGQLAQLIDNLTRRQEAQAEKQDERHEQNSDKFTAISVKMAYAAGVCMVVVVLVQHFWR